MDGAYGSSGPVEGIKANAFIGNPSWRSPSITSVGSLADDDPDVAGLTVSELMAEAISLQEEESSGVLHTVSRGKIKPKFPCHRAILRHR